MANRSVSDKEARNRSTGGWFSSIVFAVLFVVIGLILGVAHLALIPVQTVRNLPAPEKRAPHTVYYVRPAGGNSPSYQIKQNTLVNLRDRSVSVSVGELNTWASDTFRFAKPPSEEENAVVLIPSAPKFNITDGKLNIAVLLELKVRGKTHKLLFQSEGTFARSGGVVEFKPQTSYLGSAKLPPEVVMPLVSDYIYKIFAQPEQVQPVLDAWKQLSDVRIEGDSLQLVKS